jgi:hypothetical protein
MDERGTGSLTNALIDWREVEELRTGSRRAACDMAPDPGTESQRVRGSWRHNRAHPRACNRHGVGENRPRAPQGSQDIL